MCRPLFILIFIVGSCLPFCQGQNLAPIEDQINVLIQDAQVPSMAVAILKDGKIIYEQAFGYADLEHKIKTTVHTPYQLASLSKPITATAIMKLHQQRRIKLEDPIAKYINVKKVEASISDPTIRQVLNHTAGLGTYFDLFYEDESIPETSFANAWEKYGFVFQEPGQVSEYSNLGYGLLSHFISQQSGYSYAEYLASEIFNPLEMHNSFVIEKGSAAKQNLARQYGPKMEVLPSIWNNTPGAGNVASSVHDLMRFAGFHLQSLKTEVLSPKLVLEMQEYQEPNALFHYYQDSFYGLGWYLMPNDNGQRVIWHEGGMMGASSMLKLYPKENIAIALLTNTYAPQVLRSLTDSIAATVIPNYLPTLIKETAEYQAISAESSLVGQWKGLMHIEGQQIPISMKIDAQGIEISYPDADFSSFLTNYEPLPYTSKLLFGAVNQNYFIGTGMGELPASDRRKEYPHLLSFKLLNNQAKLQGTIVLLAAANREYYAHPYYISLDKN